MTLKINKYDRIFKTHIKVGIDSGIVCAGPAVVPCLRRRHDLIQDRRTDALYGTAVCPGPVIVPAFIEVGQVGAY